MITGINESKTLTNYVLCKYECKFNTITCNSNQKWSRYKCRCECKNTKKHRVCEKAYIWNPATCSCEKGKYVTGIIDNSVIMCHKIIDTTKTVTKISITER